MFLSPAAGSRPGLQSCRPAGRMFLREFYVARDLDTVPPANPYSFLRTRIPNRGTISAFRKGAARPRCLQGPSQSSLQA